MYELPEESSICSIIFPRYNWKGGDIMDPVITRIIVEAAATALLYLIADE